MNLKRLERRDSSMDLIRIVAVFLGSWLCRYIFCTIPQRQWKTPQKWAFTT